TQLASRQPSLPASKRDHHPSCGVLLRRVDRDGSEGRCRRGSSRPERASSPVTGQQDCGLEKRRTMEHATIPDISIPASRIGLGTWAVAGMQGGGRDDDESVKPIHAALDVGITLTDTAPAYGFGHSEKVIGRAIAERGGRDRVVLATKVGLEQQGNALF